MGVCERSFTSALIEELQAFGKQTFTVAMLHSRLVMMRWRLKFTPIYALLSEHGGNSIAIAPVPNSDAVRCLPELSSVNNDSNGSDAKSSGINPTAEEVSSNPTSQSSEMETRVLLSVAIAQEAEPDLAAWKTWLTNAAPWDIMKVNVEIHSVFRSHSTVILISIPVAGWNMLPERPAYRFVAFVRSGNLLKQTLIEQALYVEDKVKDDESSRSKAELSYGALGRADQASHNDIVKTRRLTPRRSLGTKNETSLTATAPLLTPPSSTTGIASSSWLPDQDKRLMHLRQQGLDWQYIASRYCPAKTPNACRKRHERLMEKQATTETAKLGGAYSEVREQMWRMLGDRLGVKWTTVEEKVRINLDLPAMIKSDSSSVWRRDFFVFKSSADVVHRGRGHKTTTVLTMNSLGRPKGLVQYLLRKQ